MNEATLVYPHQLFKNSPALSPGRSVILVEEPLLLTYNPIHRQKLIFHKLSMSSYKTELEKHGYHVSILSISKYSSTKKIFKHLKELGITRIHVVDTSDYYLEKELVASKLERVWYDSPLFILETEEAKERYLKSKRLMATFYKKLRLDKNILIEKDQPVGKKWSFDAENRQKLSKNIPLPQDPAFKNNEEIKAATSWSETVTADAYGDGGCWLPYDRASAEKFLQEFFRTRFLNFGTYEDAIATEYNQLFHSAISPLLNVGLLEPKTVLEKAISYAKENNIPLNSLEGFVRQILGWREFIRAAYEVDGIKMRTSNFWQHHRPLPKTFWSEETQIVPLDTCIKKALARGYNHHIERLMVLGNFMLLSQTNPNEVYRWFMGMYLDAYDWVMVPNVYGMSQFADGGLFATKPYISGSNYLKKMSDYPSGKWEELWTALYWNFIAKHKDFFSSNHRLSMMPKLLEKMPPAKKAQYQKIAAGYFKQTN